MVLSNLRIYVRSCESSLLGLRLLRAHVFRAFYCGRSVVYVLRRIPSFIQWAHYVSRWLCCAAGSWTLPASKGMFLLVGILAGKGPLR